MVGLLPGNGQQGKLPNASFAKVVLMVKYHAYKARVAAAAAEDRAATAARELDQVEKEGLRAERIAAMGWGKGGMEGVPKGKLE